MPVSSSSRTVAPVAATLDLIDHSSLGLAVADDHPRPLRRDHLFLFAAYSRQDIAKHMRDHA